jgi:methylphosphotriester-DNA--protein-cysteine methyltransferase
VLRRTALTGPAAHLPGRKRRRPHVWAACLTMASVLAGCSGTGSTISTAVEDSSSAIATARLALHLESSGKLTRAATSTALADSLKELETSRKTVLELSPATEMERQAVQEALGVLDHCAASLTDARDAAASNDGGPTLPDGERELAAAADRLSALGTKDGGK